MQSQAHILTLIWKKNNEGPKLKVGDHIRILKYKNTFAKGYVLLEEEWNLN